VRYKRIQYFTYLLTSNDAGQGHRRIHRDADRFLDGVGNANVPHSVPRKMDEYTLS